MMIVGLLEIFGSKLLSLFLMSAFHVFLSKCLCYRQRQAMITLKIHNSGLDRFGMSHFLTHATVISVSTHTLGSTGLDQLADHCVKLQRRAVANGGAVVPATPFEIYAPVSRLAPGCCIHPILYLKNVPRLWFLAPLRRNPGDGPDLTAPMSNATAERSFSCLRRLKNYLTNKLNQAHLNHRMFLDIH